MSNTSNIMAKKSSKKSKEDKSKGSTKNSKSAKYIEPIDEYRIESTPVTQNHNIDDKEEHQNLRQSFIIQDYYLNKLRDFVHFKKMNVNPYYTQKEALQEALDLLFSTIKKIPERPETVKLAEMRRSGKIKRGRK